VDPRIATLSLPSANAGARRVACVGLVATDFIVRTPFPVPRDTKVRSKGLVRQGGGPAANAAVALARLGVRASFVGAVGDDALGREQRDELELAGVDVANVTPCPGVSSFASFILVDEANGDRTIISAPDDRPVMGPGQSFDVAPFSLVLADGWAGPEQVRCLRDANARGVPILLIEGSELFIGGTSRFQTHLIEFCFGLTCFCHKQASKRSTAKSVKL
jgi:sugar/nucleoside kinase (ribokinase family)